MLTEFTYVQPTSTFQVNPKFLENVEIRSVVKALKSANKEFERELRALANQKTCWRFSSNIFSVLFVTFLLFGY